MPSDRMTDPSPGETSTAETAPLSILHSTQTGKHGYNIAVYLCVSTECFFNKMD